jgi:hypothetical protein
VDGNGTTGGVDGPAYTTGDLKANLIGADGKVIASVPVLSTGAYTFTGLDAGTYTVQISTVAGTPTQTPPAQIPPSNYANTGDEIGTVQGTTANGVSEPVTLTTANVTDVNFGIQQPPVANDVTAASQLNPGGNATVPVPPLSVTDPEDGTPKTITIETLPTNGTLFYNGNPVMDGVPIPNFDPLLLTVDPNPGVQTVVFTYSTTDAAGVKSPPATVTMPFTGLELSGNVFVDANGPTDGVDGSPYSAGGLNANLIGSDGKVMATVPVSPSGTYVFTGIDPGTYTVQISTVAGIPTQNPPAQTLPSTFGNTGDEIGTVQGTTPNGLSEPVVLTTTNVSDVNFGIQQPPVANPVMATSQPNPGGTTQVPVPPLSVTDPEDGTPTTITITQLPPNGTLYYDGTLVEAGTPIPNFDPTKLTVDPNDGAVTVVFPYTTTDAAGVTSPPANVTIPFTTLSISGSVFKDANGSTDSDVNGPIYPTGDLKANLIDPVSGKVIATTTVATDGTYTFTGLSGGTYEVQISTVPGVPGQLAPDQLLSGTFANTGDEIGVAQGTSPDGLSEPITLSTTNITDVNFGIQQPPVASDVSVPSQVNPGGSVAVPVPPLVVSDPEDGTPKTITIETLPTNGILYYNGNPVVEGDPIPNFDPTKLTVDPENGAPTVVFTYTTTDAAGVKSPPATVTIPFESCDLEIGGTIFIDNDGPGNGIGGTGVNGSLIPIYMTLTQITGSGIAADTTIIGFNSIDNFGKYKFSNIPAGIYRIVMSTSATGSKKLELPSGYKTVSEGGDISDGTGSIPLGASSGDGTNNGITTINVNCTNIIYETPPGARKASSAVILATGSYLANNFGITASSPLPIDLIDLSAKQLDEVVNVTWKTANEKEFSHFEIQRSNNAKEFGTIGNIKGNKSGIYNFTDQLPAEGVNFYRLKMVDLDGSSTLSKIVNVNFEKGVSFVSVENPANNGEFKVITNLKNPRFTLMTATGAKVEFTIVDLAKNEFRIKAKNSVNGVYFLNIESNGRLHTKKVLIP